MSEIDTSQLLNQLRDMAQAARGVDASDAGAIDDISFSAVLKDAVDYVNTSQQRAASLSEAFENGAPGVNLAEVMVAAQKASVSFQALLQVRNRLVAAYQEIMSMPI